MKKTLLVLPGDGIGPEVIKSSLNLIEEILGFEKLQIKIVQEDLHGSSWDKYKTFCRNEVIELAKNSDAVLVGAVGGPKWDNIKVKGGPEMQDGLMRLRKELDTFLGLRPVKFYKSLKALSPFKNKIVSDTDVLIIREMCGGIYFSEPKGTKNINGIDYGFDTAEYSSNEIERIGHLAFKLAMKRKKKLVSVDKSNVMASGALWRKKISEIGKNYDEVKLDHLLADNAVLEFSMNPKKFDVILSDNLFSDILSDLAGAINGSIGILPSGCLNGLPEKGKSVFGIYESVHGSAPDITGKGIANPIGCILSVGMMFEYSFKREDISKKILQAVLKTLNSGLSTPDLGGKETTEDITKSIIKNYEK